MSAASRLAAWRRWIFGEEGGAGLVLTGGGVGVAPTWETPGSGGGPAAQLDADGTTLSVNAIADGNLLRRTSATVVGATCTAAGYALLDDATAADQRTTLGLGTAAQSATGDFAASAHASAHVTGADQIATFGDAARGLVPASGGGTTNFLRADGTWAAPAGGSGLDEPTVLARASLRI